MKQLPVPRAQQGDQNGRRISVWGFEHQRNLLTTKEELVLAEVVFTPPIGVGEREGPRDRQVFPLLLHTAVS